MSNEDVIASVVESQSDGQLEAEVGQDEGTNNEENPTKDWEAQAKYHQSEKDKLFAQKGTLHFVLQQFNAANRCFDTIENPASLSGISELSKKYAPYKRDGKSMATSQVTALLNEQPRVSLPVLYLYYHHITKHPVQQAEKYLPLAEAVLVQLNKEAGKKLKLIHANEGPHLDLSGSSYTVYTLDRLKKPHFNILAPLNLYSLDISHTPLDSLLELRGLKLKELRMVGLNITKTGPLGYQLGRLDLNKLIIGADEYPKNFINKLRKKYEVVEE